MHDKIAVGIIGCGKHGSRYAQHLVADLGGSFHLTAVSRRSAVGRQQAEAWNTAFHIDWRELVCSQQVDAVIAAVPPHLNEDIGRLCAQMRKPLLMEKPLATEYSAAKRLVDLFALEDVPLTVAQTLRYNTVIRGLKENLPDFGRLFSLSACQRLEPSTLPWLEQPGIAGGGVIFHTAVHLFDALRFITGEEIVKIRAAAHKVFNAHLEDVVVAEIVLGNGCLGIIDAGKVSPARSGRYEFVCENGQLQGDQIHGVLEKIEGARRQALPLQPPGPTLLPLLRDWHAFLCGKAKNPIPGSEGLAAVKICHGARQSLYSDMWVDLQGVGE
jgi:predicted dehydrogenase